MLKVRDLSKSFGGARPREVLRDISLEVQRGEYVAIVGESGVGKSTLLNLIAGLDSPDRGSIALDGTDLALLDDAGRTLLRRSRIGFVFQAFHLLPHLTVAQNVALPLSLIGMDFAQAQTRLADILAAVGLTSAASAYPRELSGGEMQRVAIARALVHRPLLLLADEPTGNLDSATGEEIMRLFDRLQHEGHTIILVTHERDIAAHARRAIHIRDGKIEKDERQGA
jgi:putative ABC transport system ATP-binding protein